MIVVGRETIIEFQKKHPESTAPLDRWFRIVEASTWKNTAELRATFRDADFVAGKVVFNIGGNKYRLISGIAFEFKLVTIEAVLTHREYDKGKWK